MDKLQTCGKLLSYTFCFFSYHIQIYCGAPVDTNDNSNRNTSEDAASPHTHFLKFFIDKSHL